MNPLTQEQIQKIQSFTPEQKTLYNQTRSAGIPAVDALDIIFQTEVNKSAKTPTGDGVIFGQKSLASGIVGGVKEAITGGIRETGELADKYGAGNAIARLPLSLVAGVGRGVGEVFGSVFETADDLTGETVSGALQPVLEQAVNSKLGQNIMSGADKLDQATFGIAGDLLDSSNLLGVGLLKSAPAKMLRESIANKIKTTVGIADSGIAGGVRIAEVSRVSTIGQSLKELIRKPVDFLTKTKEAPENILQPATFSEAVSRGFSPQEARLYSSLTDVDKTITSKMLRLTEDINAGKIDSVTRASDILGENVVDKRLKPLETIEKEAGKGVEEAAKTLDGLPINQSELNDSFLKTISDYNIDMKAKDWFENSDFALTKNVQTDIKEALSYVFSPKKDGYAVHRIKKTLDGILYPQKTMEGLSGKAKSLVHQLRRDAAAYLNDNFETYKLANDKFSEIKNVLDEARDTLGDFNDVKIGARVRQVFSNSPKRKEFIDILKKVDDLGKKYNLEDIGNIYNQALFAEKLIDLFGDNAVTGFGESVKRAISRTQSIVKGLKNPIQGAGELAGTIIEKVAGQTPDDRLEFLKKLLNYEN